MTDPYTLTRTVNGRKVVIMHEMVTEEEETEEVERRFYVLESRSYDMTDQAERTAFYS